MASFDYIMIDQKGKERKGSMEGDSIEKVTAVIKSEGFIPLSVKEQNMLTKDIHFHIGGAIKSRDLCIFCRQFGSVLTAGISVIRALQMIGKQTDNIILRDAIREVGTLVEKGETLTDSMRRYNKVFPPILINLVEAGEASGNLTIAFERMAAHFEKEAKLKSIVKQAMIYPIIVCIVAIATICVMMIVVVPNFIRMFSQLDSELPAITLIVVHISNFMVKKWWLLLIILFIVIAGFRVFKNSPSGEVLLSKLSLRLPLIGKLIIKTSSARLMRTLSTLITAGISLIDALEITAKTMDNVVVKNCLLNARDEISKGVPLSQPLEFSGIFPPMVYDMIRIGEETGSMEQMLDKAADYYDEEVEAATKALTTVIEPLVIVILALLVGAIIMAVMAPMLQLYGSIKKAAA